LDQRAGREDGPHPEGSDLEDLPLRNVPQLRRHVADYLSAYNFAKHPKAMRWKTPYETIQALWGSKPELSGTHPTTSSRNRTI
jgi:hypothetical protein